MNKSIIGALIVFIAGGLVLLVVVNNNNSATQSTSTNSTTTPSSDDTQSDTENNRVITSAVVAEHNKASDCWTHINGKVYDITEYIPRHPGGDEILRACGVDGTRLFEQRTTDEGETVGSGTPHSASATSRLNTYLIGTLAQ